MSALFHMIRVSNHVSLAAHINWFPWSNHPDKVAIGWEGQPHDGSPNVYCYLIPDLEADVPLVNLYIGHAGDPSIDPIVSMWEVT